MLVPKEVFGIATHCDPGSTRYALGGVQFERAKDGVCATATDGKQLVTVTWQEPKEYPADIGLNAKPGKEFLAILPLKACGEATKLLPRKSRFPVLASHVLLDEHGKYTIPLGATSRKPPVKAHRDKTPVMLLLAGEGSLDD